MSWSLKDLLQRKCARTACLRTSYKSVALTNLNNYLYNGKIEIKLSINNSGEKLFKKTTATLGELITAACVLVVYICIFCKY